MDTLYLTQSWDLTLDSNSNIAMASNPYAPVQDSASEIQTYLGECYFNTTIGIPYHTQILGQGLPIELYRSQCISAALRVPDIVSAKVFFAMTPHRELTGQIQVTLKSGAVSVSNFNVPNQNNTFELDISNLDGPQQLGY